MNLAFWFLILSHHFFTPAIHPLKQGHRQLSISKKILLPVYLHLFQLTYSFSSTVSEKFHVGFQYIIFCKFIMISIMTVNCFSIFMPQYFVRYSEGGDTSVSKGLVYNFIYWFIWKVKIFAYAWGLMRDHGFHKATSDVKLLRLLSQIKETTNQLFFKLLK